MKSTLLKALLASAMALPAASGAADLTDGEVRKVSKDTGKITLKHGEIKSLDMPPMTMVFQMKDPALLDKLKAGDKVRFAAEKTAAGAFIVTEIQVSP
jgi:Cu(I)/Ag(I) efflux system periplasmic protein CusF